MKKLLLLSLTLCFAFFISAQNAQTIHPLAVENQYPNDNKARDVMNDATKAQYDSNTTAVRTTWTANRPSDNWFISVQGGIGQLMSEQTRYMEFKDQIKPSLGLALGKWFSPVWGLRLNVTGAKLQGFASWDHLFGYDNPEMGYGYGSWYIGSNHGNPIDPNASYTTNNYVEAGVNPNNPADPTSLANRKFIYERFLKDGDFKTLKYDGETYHGYTYDFTYVAASVDFLLNLKNLTMVYNPKGLFNPVVYGGIGFAHTFKDGDRTAVNNVMARAGLQLNFRLSDRWDFFADGQALILPENFDRRVGDGNTMDAVANYSLGFTYKFNFRHFIKAPFRDQREIDRLNGIINDLRARPDCPEVVIPDCPELPVTKDDITFLPTPVFFLINSSIVRDSQWPSISQAAEFLLQNPNARLKLTGYADRQTGNPTINKRLSEQRARAVADILIERFGIEPERLDVTYLGDLFQPFAENDWNRVVIFVVPD